MHLSGGREKLAMALGLIKTHSTSLARQNLEHGWRLRVATRVPVHFTKTPTIFLETTRNLVCRTPNRARVGISRTVSFCKYETTTTVVGMEPVGCQIKAVRQIPYRLCYYGLKKRSFGLVAIICAHLWTLVLRIWPPFFSVFIHMHGLASL